MRYYKLLNILSTHAVLAMLVSSGLSQEQGTNFTFHFDPLSGENANLGGILFPRFYAIGTFGALESGAEATDFASNEHDPQKDAAFQNVEASVLLNINDKLVGRITAFGQEGAEEWSAEVEEYFLRYNFTPAVTLGGGQFLNFFGFQSHRHLHGWDYVNNNLANSRLINEGELITQGGHLILKHPDEFAMLTIGAGGVRTHAHEHEEEEGHDDDHHLEADSANFNSWVATADLKWAIVEDGSAMGTASFGMGENGFGEMTYLYGFGIQKVWGGRDSGHGYQELAPGAFMIRSEFIGRSFDAVEIHEDDGEIERHEFDEQGVSTNLFYGLSDTTKLSFRHDFVSGIEALATPDYHRLSPALTTRIGASKRFQTRIQYDYNDSDGHGEEHVGWLQLQYQWGGTVGGYFRD